VVEQLPCGCESVSVDDVQCRECAGDSSVTSNEDNSPTPKHATNDLLDALQSLEPAGGVFTVAAALSVTSST